MAGLQTEPPGLSDGHGREAGPSHRGWLLLGAAGGLLVLARTDMALVLAALYAWLWLRRRASVWAVVGAAGVTAAVVTPWFAWSWAAVGTVVQSSAVAIPWLFRTRMADAVASGWMTWGEVAARVWRHFVQTAFYQALNYAGIGLLGGMLVLVLRGVRRVRRRARPGVARDALPGWLCWGAGGTVAALLISEFVRFSLREWYLAPLSLWGAALGGCLLAGLGVSGRARAWICLALLLVAGGQAGRDLAGRGRYWFQSDQLAAACWIAANTPEDALVGSWTAGLYGYFAGRPVVNLDGVVNWDAIHAYRARDLYGYLDEQGIGWVVDFDEFVGDFANLFGADPDVFLAPAAVFEEADAPFGRLVVYRVVGGGAEQMDALRRLRDVQGIHHKDTKARRTRSIDTFVSLCLG